ncbi:MAG: mechanosensitive ion channel domain-containing protein [Acetobacterales bacterium]
MDEESLIVVGAVADVAAEWVLSVAGAVLLLVVGWLVAGWASRAVRRSIDRSLRVDATLKPLISSLVRYAILVLVLIAVLAQFGVQTTSVIAILGAAGIAIGLALQGTLSNIAAGTMILFLRPFQVGDYIDAQGLGGTVTEIGLFTCELKTADGVYLVAPNSQIWNRAIHNYSRLPTRRVDLDVGISYDDDIDTALRVGADLLAADSRVLKDPAPQTMVTALGDSSVDIRLRCWTNSGDYWSFLFDLNKNAKQAFEAAGLTIPFPQRDVHIIGAAAPTVPPEPKNEAY